MQIVSNGESAAETGDRMSDPGTQEAERDRGGETTPGPRFAALDLGTNNCRLLIATPEGENLRIVDAFSRIVRLGEGLSASGVLSDAAMARTIDALKVCAGKISRRGGAEMRCITTQACRMADNGTVFLERIRDETGLEFEIISTEEEARLAAAGCADLIDDGAEAALIFDIGGGSTEISWMRPTGQTNGFDCAAWASMPFGVVNLAEKWGGRELDLERYEAIVDSVRNEIAACGDPAGLKAHFNNGNAHVLGTSGTVTSIAGVSLGLKKYRRDRVDGLWLEVDQARRTIEKLRTMSFDARVRQPCIGADRADLVVCGCAILEALIREWPTTRIRVADRGLREGILADLASQSGKLKRRRRKRRKKASTAKP
jgi:exopolyphosphatase / guanosine-5'-triphosphate,3'-diphosphate pyrophosphatase